MEQYFNKLVRDNIPNIIENNGEIAVTRVLSDQEYKEELLKKLKEETDEVIKAETKKEIMEELADVLEVIKSLAELEGEKLEKVIEVADSKKTKRGCFSKKIFLEKTISRD